MAINEIGIEWVDDYHSAWWPDLMDCQHEAERFRNKLDGVHTFSYGDDSAWDEDFEEQGAGFFNPAGTDTSYADNVDIVFYSGHGSTLGPHFGVGNHDSGEMHHDELRLGNKDLEWAVFDACQVLEEGAHYYHDCYGMFCGLHFILGFHTVSHDSSSRGEIFADYLNSGETVRNAWIKACQETEKSGTQWAYLRADSSGTTTYTEQWPSAGTRSDDPDPATQTIYYLRGAC